MFLISMKRRLNILFIFMIFCTSIIYEKNIVFAKTNDMGQHPEYKNIIKKYAAKMDVLWKEDKKTASWIGKYKTYYAFVDIDENGVDECILKYKPKKEKNVTTASGSGYGEATSVFTLKDGKIKTIIPIPKLFSTQFHDNYCHIYKNSSYIDRGFLQTGEVYDFYKYKDGKIKKKAIHMEHVHGHCSINGKKVRLSVFIKKVKKYKANGKGYKMTKY